MANSAGVSPSPPQNNGVSRHDPPPYSGQEAPPQPVVEYAFFVYRPGAGYRFVSAFFVATLIWVLFGMLVRSSLYVIHPGKWQRVLLPSKTGEEYPVPPGIHLDSCVQGRAWKSSSNPTNYSGFDDNWVWGITTYDLPVSAESLLVVSRGQNLVGTVEIETSPYQSKDYATVRVLMSSSSDHFLEGTKACLIKRRENEFGVGIFTPATWHPIDPPGTKGSHYRIVVVLPEVDDMSTLYIKNFETDVPGNAHIAQDLSTKVFFDRIALSGTKGFVAVKSIKANIMNISTTGNAISGNFNAAKALSLSTTYADIIVNANLTSRERENSTFNLKSNGGDIRARINLLSPTLFTGSFSINANNSGGGVQLVFPASFPPLNISELHVKAITSGGQAAVTLPPAYEGSFDLRTDYGDPVVKINPEIDDPFRLGRKRRLSFESVDKGAVAGYVDWGHSGLPQGKGTISLISSSSHYLNGVQLYG